MKLSARDRALLGVVAALLLIGAFYLLALRPQYKQADRLSGSIAAAQKQLAAAQSKYATGRAAERQLDENRPTYLAAERAVPRAPDIPALLTLLQRKERAAHVSIQSISLSGSASGSSSSATTPSTTSTTTASGSGSAGTVPVTITIAGGYQALNRMVGILDSLVAVSHGRLKVDGPLIGISSVSLSPGGSSGGTTTKGLTIQLSANIYQRAAGSSASGSTSGGTS